VLFVFQACWQMVVLRMARSLLRAPTPTLDRVRVVKVLASPQSFDGAPMWARLYSSSWIAFRVHSSPRAVAIAPFATRARSREAVRFPCSASEPRQSQDLPSPRASVLPFCGKSVKRSVTENCSDPGRNQANAHNDEGKRSDTASLKDDDTDPNNLRNDRKSPGSRSTNLAFTLDDVGALDMLTLPTRHIAWSVGLAAMARTYSGVWNHKEFFKGAQDAIRTVFELLAAGDLQSLRGLVSEECWQKLRDDDDEKKAQEWLTAPSLEQVKVLGILWVQTWGGQGITIEVVASMRERYSYDGGDVRLRRWQRWAFWRDLEKEGHWEVKSFGADTWYHRPPNWTDEEN